MYGNDQWNSFNKSRDIKRLKVLRVEELEEVNKDTKRYSMQLEKLKGYLLELNKYDPQDNIELIQKLYIEEQKIKTVHEILKDKGIRETERRSYGIPDIRRIISEEGNNESLREISNAIYEFNYKGHKNGGNFKVAFERIEENIKNINRQKKYGVIENIAPYFLPKYSSRNYEKMDEKNRSKIYRYKKLELTKKIEL